MQLMILFINVIFIYVFYTQAGENKDYNQQRKEYIKFITILFIYNCSKIGTCNEILWIMEKYVGRNINW